ANSSSSRLIDFFSIAAAHNAETAICHPGLTSPVCAETSELMASLLTRRCEPNPGSAKREKKETKGSLLRLVLIVAILAWGFRSLVGAPFNIPSGSMLPTLYIGDYVAVSKWPYGYSRYSFPFAFPAINGRIFKSMPKRGD